MSLCGTQGRTSMIPKKREQDSYFFLSGAPTSRMCMGLHFPVTTSILMYTLKSEAFTLRPPILGMTGCHSDPCRLIMAPCSPLCIPWFALFRGLMSHTHTAVTLTEIPHHDMMSFTLYKHSPSACALLEMDRLTDRNGLCRPAFISLETLHGFSQPWKPCHMFLFCLALVCFSF